MEIKEMIISELRRGLARARRDVSVRGWSPSRATKVVSFEESLARVEAELAGYRALLADALAVAIPA